MKVGSPAEVSAGTKSRIVLAYGKFLRGFYATYLNGILDSQILARWVETSNLSNAL